MADIMKYLAVDFWHEFGDPESENFFWLGAPWLTLLVTATYLYIVLKAGPEFMRNRKPYDFKITIRLYNLILVAINTYLCVGSLISFRYLEFFDTFFFILRKKDSQISFLHVFHHGVVPPLMYIGLKFYPIPFNALLPTTNMFVHIIMYAYYGLATFGPGMQKYLWWKRYLTTLQISQFALLLLHCSQSLILRSPECKFPPTLIMINSGTALTFLLLFISFYRRTYGTKKQRSIETNDLPSTSGSILNGATSIHKLEPQQMSETIVRKRL